MGPVRDIDTFPLKPSVLQHRHARQLLQCCSALCNGYGERAFNVDIPGRSRSWAQFRGQLCENLFLWSVQSFVRPGLDNESITFACLDENAEKMTIGKWLQSVEIARWKMLTIFTKICSLATRTCCAVVVLARPAVLYTVFQHSVQGSQFAYRPVLSLPISHQAGNQ